MNMEIQEPVTLKPGIAGRLLMSDLLPVILWANDYLHAEMKRIGVEENCPEKYVRDFRTIRLDMGQGSGKSYALHNLALPGDLVICPTADMCKAHYLAPGVREIGVSGLNALQKEYFRTIWLMDFSFWPRTSLKSIREKLIISSEQRIIILG
jgi:hypothetical protein